MLACEALATKAELQELKQQINQLLGKKEDGSFDDVLQMGSLASSTILGGGVLLAQTAIQDIKVQGIALSSSADDMARAFADGSAQWIKIKGSSGSSTPLPDLSKIAKNTASTQIKTTAVAGAAATATAATMGTVASLGLSIVSLGLAIKNSTDIKEIEAQQKANEFVTDLHEQEFGNLQRVLNKYGKELEEANQGIDEIETKLKEVNTENNLLESTISMQNSKISEFSEVLEESEKINKQQTATINKAKQDFETYKQDATEVVTVLEKDINTLSKNVTVLEQNNEILQEIAQHYGEKTAKLEGNQFELTHRVESLQLAQAVNKAELLILIDDLEQDNDLLEAKSTRLAARLAILESQATKAGGGSGTNVNSAKSIANAQTKTLELMNKLGTTKDENDVEQSPIPLVEPISYEDILTNNTEGFDTTFDTLLDSVPIATPENNTDTEIQNQIDEQQTQINNLITTIEDLTIGDEQVTKEELEQSLGGLKTDLSNEWQTIIGAIIATTIVPPLDDIKNQTSPASIGSAVGTEICNQTANPDSCLNTGVVNPINDKFKNIGDTLGVGLDAANLALSTSILGRVIAVQQFLGKAWSSTFVDKTLNAVNTALAFHNAVMLSRNLGQTVGDTASLFLQAINIQSHDGSAIDVNAWMTAKFTGIAQTLLGAENYETLVKGLNAANRILTAAQGMVSALNGIKDALQEGQEIIANRVGTLGNAFLEQGIFEDGTYPWMSDNVDFKQPFSKFTNYVQNLTELVQEINELVETGIEVQENINEFKEQSAEAKTAAEELQETLTEYTDNKQQLEETKEVESASPEITNSALIQGETEEGTP